jgi:hypothetical protein
VYLVYHAFTQVKAYITIDGINLADILALISILAFGDPDCIATVERNLEALKQTNCNFSTYYIEFRHYTADVQWNNPAKCNTRIHCLNNEIEYALGLFDNLSQQLQEFVTFLQ